MNDFSRTVAFKSTTSDYELLTDTTIKNAIKARLNITSDTAYNTVLANGISGLRFCVFADTRISVNDEPYEYNEPIYHVVSGDGNINPTSMIKSIKVEGNNIDGAFYFRIS